jgi:nucleoid-associated protein YgaU
MNRTVRNASVLALCGAAVALLVSCSTAEKKPTDRAAEFLGRYQPIEPALDGHARFRDRTSDDTFLLIKEPGTAIDIVEALRAILQRPRLPRLYAIVEGDTLYSIAERTYGRGCEWGRILECNPWLIPDRLMIGEAIYLPEISSCKSAYGRKDEP